MGSQLNDFIKMDIYLIAIGQRVQISPHSIHGMLWLQTHFDKEHWESLAEKKVLIPQKDAKALQEDAESSGLILQSLNSLSNTKTKVKRPLIS